jgi:hypothetical protein
MDKNFIIFVAIGIGFLYFITNFVNDIKKMLDIQHKLQYLKMINMQNISDMTLLVDLF